MLLRLELVGFKSFAEKTSLDFAPGITAIVGPNGSGKSNIVDALRWLVGEQSVRSLRGDEMTDIIFHGSAKRKSLGLAEVSLVLNNQRRLLAIDADLVQLTRRLYRDGSSEYWLNQQPVRLKDFRELFLGSGAGARGYTIIAQGRVDELLQASPQQRRELFDEAAGISRFKVRKQETLRKLSQVEQHLARSHDHLQVLQTQLRTCRLQAAKAEKYQEYQQRLHELRWQWLSSEEHRLQQAIAQLEQFRQAAAAQTQYWQQQLQQLQQAQEDQHQQQEQQQQHHEQLVQAVAEIRRQIAGEAAALPHQQRQVSELEEQLLQWQRRRAEAMTRWQSLEVEQRQAEAQWQQAHTHTTLAQQRWQQLHNQLEQNRTAVRQLEQQLSQLREEQFEAIRSAAAARTAAQAALAEVQRLQHELQRRHNDTARTACQRQTLQTRLEELTHLHTLAQQRLQEHSQLLQQLHHQQHQLDTCKTACQQSLEQLRLQYGDLRGRWELLEEWERTQQGVDSGVRFLLEQRQQLLHTDPSHPLVASVTGLVADLLVVPHDLAPLVEIVLGDKAQLLVVQPADALPTLLQSLPRDLPARVGLLPYPAPHTTTIPVAQPYCLAQQVQSPLPDLPQQLLGHVLLAEDEAQAQQLRSRFPTHRILTRSGYLWEPDGSVSVGPFRLGSGLVSRKSELRQLRVQVQQLQQALQQSEEQMRQLLAQQEQLLRQLEQAHQQRIELEKQAAQVHQALDQQHQLLEHVEQRWTLIHQETRYLEEELRRAEATWLQAHQQAEEADRAAEQLRQQIMAQQQIQRQLEAEQDRLGEAVQQAQVALSQAQLAAEQQQQRLAQVQAETRKRRVEILDLQAAERTLRQQLQEATLALLHTRSRLAMRYAEQQQYQQQLWDWSQRREQQRQAVAAHRARWLELQQQWAQSNQRLHDLELQSRDLHAQRRHLHQRVYEELGLDPDTWLARCSDITAAQADPQTLLQQIDELKRKIVRLGAVNLEALEQLQQLETEYQQHNSQHEDLVQARRCLLEIIEQLNEDSRRLFVEMLTAVRVHFQELFRKLFGGGHADIVLENEQQMLDCGIDIVAQPPGKELRTLSLLSGGERTLTAIALLLAIFRAKPSPFCILDEVDAALDEANTVRLAALLREFLDVSQFIIVTHKKRMMAAADRLWGVTMTDQGVSRVLPLRFEEWESAAEAA
jgi:chromosome segregation protein